MDNRLANTSSPQPAQGPHPKAYMLHTLMLTMVLIIGFAGLYVAQTENSKGVQKLAETYSTAHKDVTQGLIEASQFQAVFIEGRDETYFGKLSVLDSQNYKLTDIYYLNLDEGNQDKPLTKLGCELHGPGDEMIITRTEVKFWENLKDDGQVAKAIEEYKKANPEGQKCMLL